MKWEDLFFYDNGVLYWKVRRNGKNGGVRPGDIAGCKNNYGYVVIGVNGKLYYRHSIVWEMHNGKVPNGFEIDHIHPVIDGCESNDSISNLRVIEKSENLRKGSGRKRSNNKSGVRGVSYCNTYKKWKAEICVNGFKHSKSFDSFEDAVKQRKIYEELFII
ncbi:HNH endonuclease [Salmonella enterica subsp. enterica serovar 4,[5],12:i:-]|nr:HNH endonuclease [Salmonella enterica subsp. enterica serovar 4,[5],12:i:-]